MFLTLSSASKGAGIEVEFKSDYLMIFSTHLKYIAPPWGAKYLGTGGGWGWNAKPLFNLKNKKLE